jgi:hypothetical protein
VAETTVADCLGLPGNFMFDLILGKMSDPFWAQKIVKVFPFKLKGIRGTVLQIFA